MVYITPLHSYYTYFWHLIMKLRTVLRREPYIRNSSWHLTICYHAKFHTTHFITVTEFTNLTQTYSSQQWQLFTAKATGFLLMLCLGTHCSMGRMPCTHARTHAHSLSLSLSLSLKYHSKNYTCCFKAVTDTSVLVPVMWQNKVLLQFLNIIIIIIITTHSDTKRNIPRGLS